MDNAMLQLQHVVKDTLAVAHITHCSHVLHNLTWAVIVYRGRKEIWAVQL